MCGFALTLNQNEQVHDRKILDLLKRRGPDSEGQVSVNKFKLFHTRLSIRDLSQSGAQPMEKDGVYLCYNGELYNEESLIKSLGEQRNNVGTSDTELLLDFYLKFGIQRVINEINGMYAFTIVDTRAKTIYVVTDRFGEKPVYLSESLLRDEPQEIGTFCISSEIKVISASLCNDVSLRANSIQEFLEFGYISAPFTIFNEISKLEPGHVLKLQYNENNQVVSTECYRYFNYQTTSKYQCREENYEDFQKRITSVLSSSVRGAMTSDVPVCTMLSGGIDSALITYFASLNQKVVSYTLGFSDQGFDESNTANFVANKLEIENRNILFEPEQFEELIDASIKAYGEPFADSSQIAAMLMSSQISKDFKVCLTGDGADEIFFGYNRHVLAPRLWKTIENTPNFILHLLTSVRHQRALSSCAQEIVTRLGFLDKRTHRIGHKLNKAFFALQSKTFAEMYLRLHSSQHAIDTREQNYTHKLVEYAESTVDKELLFQIVRDLDIKSYLPGDILVKMDRASMYYGLETRSPFLNYELLQYTASAPINFLISQNKGKRVLRDIATQVYGSTFSNLPKKGFSVPIKDYVLNFKNYAEIISYFSQNKDLSIYAKIIDDMKNSYHEQYNNFEFLWRVIILYKWAKIYS